MKIIKYFWIDIKFRDELSQPYDQFIKKHPEHAIIIDHEQYECNELYEDLYNQFREELFEPLVDDILSDDYKTHALYGPCFWYNLTFGLTLARKLYSSSIFYRDCY